MNQTKYTEETKADTSETYSMTANNTYRNVVLGICIQSARCLPTRQELINTLAAVSAYVCKTSETPNIDESFMDGISIALVGSRWWEQ